jgi:hypothetical protein
LSFLRTLTVCCLLVAPGLASAQVFPELNGKSLAGVRAFDAHVVLQVWLAMTQDKDRFEKNVQSAFELALRRDGVVVDQKAPNYLFCDLKFAEGGSGLVAYSYQVAYYTVELQGPHRLQWVSGGMVTVGKSKLTEESVAKDCADIFANEWLKWNPRR